MDNTMAKGSAGRTKIQKWKWRYNAIIIGIYDGMFRLSIPYSYRDSVYLLFPKDSARGTINLGDIVRYTVYTKHNNEICRCWAGLEREANKRRVKETRRLLKVQRNL